MKFSIGAIDDVCENLKGFGTGELQEALNDAKEYKRMGVVSSDWFKLVNDKLSAELKKR